MEALPHPLQHRAKGRVARVAVGATQGVDSATAASEQWTPLQALEDERAGWGGSELHR